MVWPELPSGTRVRKGIEGGWISHPPQRHNNMAAEYGIALNDLVMVHNPRMTLSGRTDRPRIGNLIKDSESMIAAS